MPPLHSDGMLPLASGLLKAYAMRDPFLRKNAEITILEPCTDEREAPGRVSALKPDLAGFTVYGGLERTKAVAAEIKRRCGAKIIFGGPLAGSVPQAELFSGGAVDLAVAGEGEKIFALTLKALITAGDLAGIKGLSFASGGGVTANPPGEPAELSSLPSPYLEGVFKWRGYARVPFEMSRGCRESCLYCSIPRNYRGFGFARVRAEVKKILADLPEIRTLFLTDPDICHSSGMARLLRLLGGETARRGINVEIQMNLLNFSERLMPLLNDRAFSLGVGVQSIFPETCKLVNRRMDLGVLSRKAALLSVKAPRAKVVLSFIIGLPGDTFENCLANFEWGLSLNAGLYFHRLRVYPGTPLGKVAGKAGVKFMPRDPYFALSVPSMGAADMKRAAAAARELSLAANIVFSDKYFGFLFRYIARDRPGASRFPRVEMCRRINRFARAEKAMRAAAARADAFADDGDWSGLDVKNFENCRTTLIRRLAGLEGGGRDRRAFASRFADFCEARLLWERVEGRTAYQMLRVAAGDRPSGPALLVCGAASSDPAKMSGCGFSLELLMEEKLGFFPAQPAGKRIYIDRPDMPGGLASALEKSEKFSSIVVSQVLGALGASARLAVLKRLLLSAGVGARLFVIDSGLGYPEFGLDWELNGGWLDCTPESLEAGLSASGWRVTRTVPLGKWRVICAERA